jgi:GNAT superfamily N-acetyltransferase
MALCSLQTRLASPEDVGVLIALMRAFYAEEHLVFGEAVAQRALEDLIAHSDLGSIWLFEYAGAVIGYAVITFGFSLEFHGRLALLDEFYLIPAQRGRGLGRGGMELIKAWVRTTSVATLRLEVNPSNTRARSLYQHAGFHDEKRDLFTCWLQESGPCSA